MRVSLKQQWTRIVLLMVLAGALLGWLSAHTEVLFADGLRYIRQAKTLARGDWDEGLLKAVDQPVYPLTILAAHRVLGGDSPEAWQLAAQAASIVAGILLVVPLYLVARELFGDASAWLACLLTFAVPLTGHVFADALSESTFLLFWTWGLWTALRFLGEGAFGWLLPTIGFAVLAYLSRPEGLLLPLALVATLGVIPCVRPLRLSRSRWWAAVGFLVIGPACLIGPYVAIKGGLGTKPSVARLLGTAPKSAPLAVERTRPLEPDQTWVQTCAWAAKAVFEAVRNAVTIPLLAMALVGLFAHRSYRARGRGWLLLAIIASASVLALLRLHATGGYCSPRHALILALPLIAASASGVVEMIAAFVAFVARRAPRLAPSAGAVAWSLVLVGLLASFGPRTLANVNEGLGGYRAAGQWLEAHVPAEARVVDVTGWSLFYGQRQGYTFQNLIQAPGDQGARWIVAREAHLQGPWLYCGQLRSLVGGAAPVAVFRGANHRHPTKVYIFDRQRASSSTTVAAPAAAIRR